MRQPRSRLWSAVPITAVANASLIALLWRVRSPGPDWLATVLGTWFTFSTLGMLAISAVELGLALLRRLGWVQVALDAVFSVAWATALVAIWAHAMQRVI